MAAVGRIRRAGLRLAWIAGAVAAVLVAATYPVLFLLGQPSEVLQILLPYWLCSAAALLPWCLTLIYKQVLDALDRPWLGVLLSLPTLLLNALFNAVLIHGLWGFPALGLTGAGLGSLLAWSLGAILMAAVCTRLRREAAAFNGPAESPKRQWAATRRQHCEGLPMGAQYLLEGGAMAVAGLMIGWLGATALAANQIVTAVASTLYMVPLGMAAAVSLRMAQALGAGTPARLRGIATAGLGLVSAWMLGAMLLMGLGAHAISATFVDDPAVIAVAVPLFLVFSLMQLMDGVQSVSLGALRALFDSHWPTRVSLLAYWLIALPLGALLGLGFGFGAAGVWGGFTIGLLVAAIALSHRLRAQLALRGNGVGTQRISHLSSISN
jgi:MATE family multidrug resistance protein